MTEATRSTLPEDRPGVATAQCGAVMLDGPGGVAVTMMPEAAIETGHRLIAAGETARQQANATD